MTLPQTILLALGGFVLLVILLELVARLWIRRGNYYVFAPGQRLHLEIDVEQVPGVGVWLASRSTATVNGARNLRPGTPAATAYSPAVGAPLKDIFSTNP